MNIRHGVDILSNIKISDIYPKISKRHGVELGSGVTYQVANWPIKFCWNHCHAFVQSNMADQTPTMYHPYQEKLGDPTETKQNQ